MSQLLFTAFSNRIDAIELAREAALRLEGAGIASSMYLLDSDVAPVITEAPRATLIKAMNCACMSVGKPG